MNIGIFVPNMPEKPTALMRAVHKAFLKTGCSVKFFYPNQSFSGDLIILYGWGGSRQQELIQKINCNYVAFDLGYWSRSGFKERKWRISINDWHCPDLIINGPYFGNERKSPVVQKNSQNSEGHILLVGSSPKSLKVAASGWSKNMAHKIRKQFPNSKLVYRPKPERKIEQIDCDSISKNCDIKDAFDDCKLVVCRHSNVSVDAAIAGVPCVAEDGAGSAIYPKKLQDFHNQPDIKLRRTFINHLAWWQWSINEINNNPTKFTSWIEAQINALSADRRC